jgi:hypothetical protein
MGCTIRGSNPDGGKIFFTSPKSSRPALGRSQPPTQWVHSSLPWGKAAGTWRRTTHHNIVRRLRTSGVIPFLPLTPSQCGQGKFILPPRERVAFITNRNRLVFTEIFGIARLRLKRDGTRVEIIFRLSAIRTSPFKTEGASVQSTTGSRGVRISGSNAGYTVLRGSVKSTGCPLPSQVFPSSPHLCVTVCHHISTWLYNTVRITGNIRTNTRNNGKQMLHILTTLL